MVCESTLLIFSPSCLPPTHLPLQFCFFSCQEKWGDAGLGWGESTPLSSSHLGIQS